MPTSNSMRVAVIGGGISGLAAAHRLMELLPDVALTLFEGGERLGGVLFTEHRDGFLLEHSADNFITSTPWAIDLCRRLGLEAELLNTNAEKRRAYVVHRGRLELVPEGFQLMAPARIAPFLRTPILSPLGKLRLLCEWFIPQRHGDGDESLASFVRRRLGKEAYERLVQPLVGGIYTADAEQLSVQAALPRFVQMEREYGSLIRALRKQAFRSPDASQAAGARYSMFLAPANGISSIIAAIAGRLPADSVRLRASVARIERDEVGGWSVLLARESQKMDFDAVIVAVPAHQAAVMLNSVDYELSADLAQIPYAGCAIALASFRRDQIDHPLDGFGFVVPEIEHRQILAGSFSSIKFPGRAAEGQVLIRVFVGGAKHPELVDLPDAEMRALVLGELGDLLPIRGEPNLFQIVRWRRAMPQYHLGHNERVARIEARAAAHNGLQLAGNAYHGVGIPDCIHSGEQAAERIVALRT